MYIYIYTVYCICTYMHKYIYNNINNILYLTYIYIIYVIILYISYTDQKRN